MLSQWAKSGPTLTFTTVTINRSSWFISALRDDKAVYWVSIVGHYEAEAGSVEGIYALIYWTGVTDVLGKTSTGKNVFFQALPESPIPPPWPQFRQLGPLFLRQKRRFACMTGKNLMLIMKVAMIIMMIIMVILMIIMTKMTKKNIQLLWSLSKKCYFKDSYLVKKGPKIRAWVDPPPYLGNARKKTFYFCWCLP